MRDFVIHIIRMILECTGFEMDTVFCMDKPYGSTRSIVRKIAANLPLKPCPRVQFQILPYTQDSSVTDKIPREDGTVTSLADVSWIMDDEMEACTGLRSENRPFFISSQQHLLGKPLTRQVSLPVMCKEGQETVSLGFANNEAIQKISALENELARLREQIAQIVLVQEKNSLSATGEMVSPSPLPESVSPALPPPPPPLPPPPPPCLQRSVSAIDLIKERKGKKMEQTTLHSASKPPDVPNMLDVLKDINKVKLRSVKRPLENTAKVQHNPPDAATLIAEALKRKFAYRHRSNSQSELDVCVSSSDVHTRVAPAFGQHLLKSTGKRGVLIDPSSS
ncbi:mitochondrial fission regulator 1 [Erpetoichthys calabaricus]|uniref:mitochondrial fission regulator 1 n=1 Tax=Erpetoichthys calabaricus TaxID=27687 RepID=UPI002234DD5A|nr:mitochondrial fission regulator 1 [Erpetoichthys calabaricus]